MKTTIVPAFIIITSCTGACDTSRRSEPGDPEFAPPGDSAEFLPTDSDGDGHVHGMDCDEGDPSVYVGAVELCDGVDNNCDGWLGGE